MVSDKDVINWIFRLAKEKKTEENFQKAIQLRRVEIDSFLHSNDKQAQLYSQQLNIMEKQTKILNETKRIYFWILIMAILNFILLSIDSGYRLILAYK